LLGLPHPPLLYVQPCDINELCLALKIAKEKIDPFPLFQYVSSSMLFSDILWLLEGGDRNDAIHLPTHICGWLWKSELQFWKIPLTKISECCFSAVAKYCDNENLSANLKAAFTVQETPRLSSMTYLRRLRHRFWLFLDEPSSSKCARVSK
jgi:hypothetical protein